MLPTALLMGPTASGKSAIALDIASRLPVEIVSVDSAQVYCGMDIGTAKPDLATRRRVAHHLIDIIDPDKGYSAARFRDDARRAIEEVHARGRVPLLVGGTMLYFKVLREGLSNLPGADASVRGEIDARAASLGWPAMHVELSRIDPDTAARLDRNDAQRIQRALEVHAITGRSLSSLQGARGGTSADEFVAFALFPADRAQLHRRIADRFDAMLAAGLVDEVRALRDRHALSADMASMRCVGYRQALQFLDGDGDLAALRERGIAATRQLAKRQLTWLRATPARMFDSSRDAPAAIAAHIAAAIQGS